MLQFFLSYPVNYWAAFDECRYNVYQLMIPVNSSGDFVDQRYSRTSQFLI